MPFAPGGTLTVREVWADEAWLHFPELVVADDPAPGGVLATLQRDGTPLTFPEHPGGPHPWSHQTHWRGTTVLKLRRVGDWYSIWRFFDADGTFTGWYVNFESPYVRRDDGIDINDLQLDIVVRPDGTWVWKDVEDLAPTLASGRLLESELRAVLAEATVVADLLDRDERWWASWDSWFPQVS